MDSSHILTVGYIFIQDSRMLLVKAQGMDAFYMPGGKLEAGESDKDGLVREIAEELGVIVDSTRLTHVVTVTDQAYNKPKGVQVEIRCYTGKHSGDPVPSSEIQKMQYFSFDEYMHEPETAPAVRRIFRYARDHGMLKP